MDDLHHWMSQRLEQKLVEPNSGLGQAFNYCSVNGIGHTRSHKKRPNQPPILLELS
jgi:hypothetical protein